jgi:hypothetical protein
MRRGRINITRGFVEGVPWFLVWLFPDASPVRAVAAGEIQGARHAKLRAAMHAAHQIDPVTVNDKKTTCHA